MDSEDKLTDKPISVIFLNSEPDELVVLKWLGWLVVMVLFVLMLIWFGKYFYNPVCDVPDHYIEGLTIRRKPLGVVVIRK
jgi:hypothetical protein